MHECSACEAIVRAVNQHLDEVTIMWTDNDGALLPVCQHHFKQREAVLGDTRELAS